MGPMRRALTADSAVLEHKIKKGTTRRILKFAAPYRWLLALFLFIVVVDAFIGIANPLIFRSIINNGILHSNAPLVIHLALLVGILAIFDAACSFATAYLSARIGNDIVLLMRTKLFDHIQKMPLAFFTRTQTGSLVSRLNNDVTGAQTAFTDVLSNVIGNFITLVLILAAMFTLSWQITLASLILLPLFIFPARYFGRKLQQITRESYDLLSVMNNVMIERFNVAGAQLAKLFGRPQEDSKSFEEKAARVSAIGVKSTVYGRFLFTALMLMAAFATALAYGWGGVLAIRGVLDVGTIVALVAYLARLYSPLIGLSNVQVSVATALVSFERVFEILDLKPMIEEKPDAVTIAKGPSKIAFQDVSFRYPTPAEVSLSSLESIAVTDKTPEKMVLHDVSFIAQPGELVALVGPSGAGKTTITQLVARLYDAQSGSVSINDTNVRDATLDSLHEKIGMVTQDSHLFHDTIRANLLYAKPDATDEEITDALRAAQILPLIKSLPKGVDTLVGERGYRFSGGEKQRLAIARLLLKAPDIVILDEATAHLDSESEAAIQKAFEVALTGRTSIVIAHRLSTILTADQILVVQDGHIVERGSHQELLQNGKLYADLYRRQFEKHNALYEKEGIKLDKKGVIQDFPDKLFDFK
jgi:ATP-binding cassette subfamily B protein